MAQQIELFAQGPWTIADDERGAIAYMPGVFAPRECARLFNSVFEAAAWSRDTIWMYDRVVDVPRLVAHYAPGTQLPAVISEIQKRAEAVLQTRFNAVGLNYYRDAEDSVAWHSDRNEGLIELPTIAILSLGAARRMLVRPKQPPRTAIACGLEPGSLFVMRGRSQEFWEHCVPKESLPTAARISLAFRQRLIA